MLVVDSDDDGVSGRSSRTRAATPGRLPADASWRGQPLPRDAGRAVSRNQIEESDLGKGHYLRHAIDRLIAEGFATEIDGARGAKLVELVRAFRGGEPEA